MNLRIFVAIKISEKLQNKIADWRLDFLSRNPGAFFDLRWIEDKNLHITLIPPWYEDESGIEKVIRDMRQATRNINPFEIEFNKATYGPEPRLPRLIWAEGTAPQKLLDLKSALEKIFSRHKNEYREWITHLTIARFKLEDFHYFSLKKLDEKISWREKIESVVLMESRLSPVGANYEAISEVPL